MESSNSINIDHLRLEIATLVESVNLNSSVKGKFKINAVMQNYNSGKSISANSNVYNKRISSNTIINSDHIKLDIPIYMRIFFNGGSIPKNTRFIVSFIGANINDARIVGLYDMEDATHEYSYAKFIEEYNKLKKRVKALENITRNHEGRISALEAKI